jgi:hypothetical protein
MADDLFEDLRSEGSLLGVPVLTWDHVNGQHQLRVENDESV